MPYLRQRPRIPATGKIAVRLSTAQRDLLMGSAGLPREIVFTLKRAPVKKGKLEVRVRRASLDAMILAAAAAIPELPPAPVPRSILTMRRQLDTFVRYVEDLEDRFEDEADSET
jgi:hypothetical protein